MIRSLILFFSIQILSLGSFAQVAVKDCNPGYFIKSYRSSESKIEAQGFCVFKNNHSITVGQSPNDDVNDNSDAFLLKVDGNGNKLLEKVYGGTGHQSFSKILSSGDGNLVAAGIETLGQDFSFFITRLDTSANVLWKRSYAFTLGVNFAITDLQEDKDGSIYMTCFYVADGLSSYDRVMYVKFDANGNMRYAKSFIPPGDINDFFPYSFLIDGDYTYITGNYHSYYHYDGLLMKIKNATGELLWAKNYDFNGGGAIYFQVFPYNNQLCIIGNNDVYETDTSIILVCDTSGKVQNTHYMQGDDRRQGKAVMDAAGDITWLNYNFRYSSVNPIHLNITKMNPAKGVTWSRNFNQLPRMREITGVGYASDSSLIFSGQHLDTINELKIFSGRLSPSGELACEPEPVQVHFGEGTSIAKDLKLEVRDYTFAEVFKSWVIIENRIDKVDTFCYQKNSCTFLKLSAPDTLCKTGDTLSVVISKDADCISTPTFMYDASMVKLLDSTSFQGKFVFLKQGVTTIKCFILAGCALLEDSVTVYYLPSPGQVSLGKDTSLCKDNTVQLKAGEGYVSYLWQDGSAGSVYLVTAPGIYHVRATDACGNSFMDTVKVIEAPPISFDLGPDRTKCNTDTLHLSAPPGFLNYKWSNNYNISSTFSQTVVVSPLMDTAYYIKAEKTPGCFAYDTVRIIVNHSFPIDLGIDKSFCNGDSVVFDAGSGFKDYRWSTGAGTPQITVNSLGTYTILATNADGCKSYDTVKVLAVYTNPVVSLDHNNTLCMGSSRILNAGSFSSYKWSDGSTARTLSVNHTGIYYVEVMDANGCKGSDTTVITELLPVPENFLPADTAICSYGSLTLKPIHLYNTYAWSNSATASSITIMQPGRYWLQVKDVNQCIGRDTILVDVKDCMSGFYIPTAFTPDGDGKNDAFRPLLFGRVKKYNFTVYNRWGQVVFQSSELGKGWSGTYASTQQDSNVFAWTCIYQLEGQEVKAEKGTVVLIR